jgi:hypothetical protein
MEGLWHSRAGAQSTTHQEWKTRLGRPRRAKSRGGLHSSEQGGMAGLSENKVDQDWADKVSSQLALGLL